MIREFHLGHKSTKNGYWTSFENDPYHSTLKKTIRYRCTPCIENLYRQLIDGRNEIQLDSALNCWKVVAVLNSEVECLQLLSSYQEKFLPYRNVRGRFGSKEAEGTKAIVINADTEKDRNGLLLELRECAKEINLDSHIFYSRGCAYLFEELLGDWHEWKRVMPIKYPEKIEEVIERIRKALEIS